MRKLKRGLENDLERFLDPDVPWGTGVSCSRLADVYLAAAEYYAQEAMDLKTKIERDKEIYRIKEVPRDQE